LPLSERFVLWALRQWQQDRALPSEGSILYRGFEVAGLLEVLPDFAIAMDAFLFGARRAFEIHQPTCSSVAATRRPSSPCAAWRRATWTARWWPRSRS
jgi:hypothetical protein